MAAELGLCYTDPASALVPDWAHIGASWYMGGELGSPSETAMCLCSLATLLFLRQDWQALDELALAYIQDQWLRGGPSQALPR